MVLTKMAEELFQKCGKIEEDNSDLEKCVKALEAELAQTEADQQLGAEISRIDEQEEEEEE